MTRRKPSSTHQARSNVPALTPHQQAILNEASRKITIRGEGQSQQIGLGDAIIRKYAQVALSGSPHALGRVTQEIIAAQKIHQAYVDQQVHLGHAFRTQQQRKLHRVLADGGDEDSVLPHPDDIQIIETEGYRVTGPWNEAELEMVRKTCALRDQLLLQSVLEDRLADQTDQRDGTSALVMAQMFNQGLPKRFYLSRDQMVRMLMRLEGATKRELLTQTYLGWKALDWPHPRGYRLPAISEIRRRANGLQPMIAKLIEDLRLGNIPQDDRVDDYVRDLVSTF